jgi:DNA-binding beta-propeller fold protein YncE
VSSRIVTDFAWESANTTLHFIGSIDSFGPLLSTSEGHKFSGGIVRHPRKEARMKKSIAICLAIFALFTAGARAQVPGPLKLIQTIPLPGLKDGDFDHFQVDLPGERLFLAAEDNSAIEVIDLTTNKVVHKITGPKAPHSMAYNPDSKKLFVVDGGGPNQVEIYDGTSFELLGTIPMDAHADASVYDPVSKLFYVGNGGKQAKEDFCMLSIVDTASGKKVGDIKIDGADRVEAMAIEHSGPRMFVNLYNKAAVGVIDREKRTVIDTWSIAQEGRNNGSMAFDEADHRLFVHAREPGKVLVMDTNSGKIVTTLQSGGMVDDAVYDAKLKRIYVTGVPFINIFQKSDEGERYDLLGQVPTAFHSITAILVPQLNRYYLAVNHHGQTDAVVQVYQVVP